MGTDAEEERQGKNERAARYLATQEGAHDSSDVLSNRHNGRPLTDLIQGGLCECRGHVGHARRTDVLELGIGALRNNGPRAGYAHGSLFVEFSFVNTDG